MGAWRERASTRVWADKNDYNTQKIFITKVQDEAYKATADITSHHEADECMKRTGL
mgnify:FL=1